MESSVTPTPAAETHRLSTPTGSIWLDADGIMRTSADSETEDTLADAKTNFALCAEVAGGIRRPLLADFRRMRSMSRDARAYYKGPEWPRIFLAAAILVGSPLTRMIASFFVGLNKTYFPVRLFTSEDEAIAWLGTFVEKG